MCFYKGGSFRGLNLLKEESVGQIWEMKKSGISGLHVLGRKK